ncbi:Ig domain-containing protein [Rhodohalobacter sp. 8-1]|uniref:Ig domain-containing protein n=1 Tax=Rhodohalobacter sp. 8-1 TaxID=3131972 RepID=UPI0030EE6241
MNNLLKATLLLIFFTCGSEVTAQYNHDITREMEIPDILDIESSEAHLYVLSESEGLVVYRAYPDSLQWLYTSTGMQRRGNRLHADIRFAYLYGNSRRLTVIEPTSVLGVYSSTVLPDVPVSTRRIGNNLYIVMRNGSLGSLSLQTPESVDTEPAGVDPDRFEGRIVNDLASDANRFLYVLSDNRQIDIYQFNSTEDQLIIEESVELEESVDKIFFADNELIGADNDGNIYLIDSNGQTRLQNELGHPIDDISFWMEEVIIRSTSGQLWVGVLGDDLTQWKQNERAGNYFTVNKNRFYITEFNSIFPVLRSPEESLSGEQSASDNQPFSIQPIETVSLPFPKPLLQPIKILGYPGNVSDITLSVNSSIDGIRVRGSSLFWQPGASSTGRHQVSVTATTPRGRNTQTSFTVDVKPFNSPPRFAPSRMQSLPANERFELKISAFDPDGTHPELIRYLGVDLPNGASLNEQTGVFSWEPTIRQVGDHQFRVIATDQFGAAASQDYNMQVIEMTDIETEDTENGVDL